MDEEEEKEIIEISESYINGNIGWVRDKIKDNTWLTAHVIEHLVFWNNDFDIVLFILHSKALLKVWNATDALIF